VAERRREMGVRLALGAAPAALRRLVVGQGIRLAALSAVIGLAGAAVTGRLIRSLLFEVGSIDVWAMGSAALLLSGAAVLASWLPAERAARTSPLEAIRE
jgi:ABC-type antimicrobial peptide transport system permease subunit